MRRSSIQFLIFLTIFLTTTTASWATPHKISPSPLAPQADLSIVPAAAQAWISASLGRDDSHYWVVGAAEGFRMQNPQHQLTVELSGKGIKVANDTARWGFQLTGFGYGKALKPAGKVAAEGSRNRVVFRRGDLTEWYTNGPLGLEQGFTLAQPPGKADGKPLTVALSLSGDVVASLEPNGKGLRVTQTNGQVAMRYTGLTASDATGRALRSWLELSGTRLLLHVDDRGATYPLVIDPLVQQAKLTPSDEAGIRYIAMEGDTIVVGAEVDYGQWAAYVFVKPANGWANATEVAKLTPSDGAAHNPSLGHVAISGDTIVLGSNDARTDSPLGAAYVFVKPATGWVSATETAKLTASDGAAGFGASVGLSGDTVVVGAPQATIGSIRGQGAAYVFVKPATGWVSATETAKLTASVGGTDFYIGTSVAISGDTLVVGSLYASAAYLFVKPPTGGWVSAIETAKLTASDVSGEYFSEAVAINGDTVVIGAGGATIGANLYQGAAYAYVKPSSGWVSGTETAKLTASDGAAGDWFGASVDISGDKIVVGAFAAEVDSQYDQGAAYLFVKPQTGWVSGTETQKLTVTDTGGNFEFGWGVAISGDTVAVIPNGIDPGGTIRRGRSVYVFVENLQYTFSGFFSTVQNLPAVNDAKAGQTIPVKWFITDAAGAGVNDPSSFAGITSYPVPCLNFNPDSSDSVKEYASGNSGLQNIGGGYWQFNWSTPKSYAGTCRVMELTLKDGSKHKANFDFTK